MTGLDLAIQSAAACGTSPALHATQAALASTGDEDVPCDDALQINTTWRF